MTSEAAAWTLLIKQVCDRLTALTGNILGERQKPMVEARLKRHLRELKVEVADYPRYWREHQTQEDDALIALLTTHFTSFFREFLHFEWLESALPDLTRAAKEQGRSEIKIWSAACSRGQEVWSLGMWLAQHMPRIAPGMNWSVYGTDIDVTSVSFAKNGVYHHRELEAAPRQLWQPYWQRGTGDISDWMRVKKELRDRCTFGVDNLLSLSATHTTKYDVIFCRNVLIYFDPANQAKAVKGLLGHLHPHGSFVSGVSESLGSLGLGLQTLAPSVYSLQAAASKKPVHAVNTLQIPKPLRVLCIDDSGTVITILKKLLSGSDFEVVGTAENGEKGLKLLGELNPDVVTLDLHMPVMDGFTLIKNTDSAQRYPIVVVSTVERDNATLVHPLFAAGICDFVEKPSFENLSRIGEELQQKLKMAWWSKKRGLSMMALEPVVSRAKRQPGRVVLNAGLSDREAVQAVLKASDLLQDEVFVHLSGETHLWEDWALGLRSEFMSLNLKISRDVQWVRDGKTTVVFQFRGGQTGILDHARSQGAQIVLEDGEWSYEVKSYATDIFPVTSFAYMAQKFLEGK